MTRTPSTRLFVLLARTAPIGVIFRRGPSKHVQLIQWNTATDKFEFGQWLKGRIYERRCDLSPSGEQLIYFAASHKPPMYSWTAVSKPPYLTALALWPKKDSWGGGGLFQTEDMIMLNHEQESFGIADNFSLPKHVKVTPISKYAGRGEDDPIYHMRLVRDGWRCMLPEEIKKGVGFHSKEFSFNPNLCFDLEMRITEIGKKGETWYTTEYNILNKSNQCVAQLGKADWADWDKNGDLLLAKNGSVFRLKPDFKTSDVFSLKNLAKLADFGGLRFEEKAAPNQYF